MKRACLLIAVALYARSMGAQPIPIFTVCEALADRNIYQGKTIVVVGRLSSTDEGVWLGEDCEQKIATEQYTWANAISLTYARGSVEPPPKMPSGFKWDMAKLKAKLRLVQKTTKLQALKEYNYTDEWFAIFGRFETRVPLQIAMGGDGKPHGYGFGHLGAAPAQLIADGERYHKLKGD